MSEPGTLMSPSDKTPKPSRKRTLEDVQQNLQDLVDNELASPVKLNAVKPKTPKQTPASRPATKATVQKKPRKSKDLLRALESLANRAAAAPEESPPEAVQASDIQQEMPQPISPPSSHAQTVSPDNLDLFKDSETASEDEASEDSPPFDNTQATSVQDRIAAVINRTRDETPIEGTVSNATQWEDDIPVLKEVAALPPVGGDMGIIHDLEPLPKPTRSRDLAVRVIAKLNIEMRKAGGPGLEPQTIKRLQTLLQEELEQQAANMDNTDNE